jgi:predicted cation transporter
MDLPTASELGLLAIILMVFLLPFISKTIAGNLELFLLVMGIFAVTISGRWTVGLLQAAAADPVSKGIVPAVLIAGLIFLYGKSRLDRWMARILGRYPLKAVIFVTVVVLGLVCSVTTAVIASLLLVELIAIIPMEHRTRIKVIVAGCFSISLGMVLTPVGEPLALLAETLLQGPPYYAGFFFLFDNLAFYIIPGCLAMGVLASFFIKGACDPRMAECAPKGESLEDVLKRAGRIYLFVMALLLLGNGLDVMIDHYLVHVPPQILYWVNMLSAILDNATLTASEITPQMSLAQIKAMLMGLLISGGMLIPGNIANIVASNKLNITSREWSRTAVPLGLALMVIYFVWIFYIPFYIAFKL